MYIAARRVQDERSATAASSAMHKAAASDEHSHAVEREPFFAMPRRPAGQKILLGLRVLRPLCITSCSLRMTSMTLQYGTACDALIPGVAAADAGMGDGEGEPHTI